MPQLFGEKLRLLRRAHRLTQVALARQLGLAAHSHIAKLESNQDVPSLSLVVRVAGLLNTTTDFLLRDAVPVGQTTTAGSGPPPEQDAPPRFGMKLRALRRSHGQTQAELAHQLGLARQGYISNLETGRKLPSIDLVVQIADYFGVTTDYLLYDTIPVALSAPDSGGAIQ
jgi:transcriptional regulator with XRE-family HTH domain